MTIIHVILGAIAAIATARAVVKFHEAATLPWGSPSEDRNTPDEPYFWRKYVGEGFMWLAVSLPFYAVSTWLLASR